MLARLFKVTTASDWGLPLPCVPCPQGALSVALEGCQELERVYRNGARAVDELKEVNRGRGGTTGACWVLQ
jgi:hypothetical protein